MFLTSKGYKLCENQYDLTSLQREFLILTHVDKDELIKMQMAEEVRQRWR